MMANFDHEPIRGLPGPLPAGEHILWQGSPDWRRLARDAFHVRLILAYFALILLAALASGASAPGLLLTALAAALCLGLLHGLALLSARTSIYTLTNRRIVLRIGMALPTAINIPLLRINIAGLRLNADGSGDIPLALTTRSGLGWFHLWPHARPWALSRPEPMLRAIPDAAGVATLIAGALAEVVPTGQRLPITLPEGPVTHGGLAQPA
ncbi:photosynthetic complex putative assembly protein PuhB [Sandaracinobacteroides saxicola]|uniref:PH domain-containing protein n=1 Tax=Sandaracinobacteroides saxicola TaxID=2759707 RepID=A0A7G5IKT7_9SPHN|nr:photosynthetic complex putative assembly protein PuhB [Sandaracinobacteroides saxicola]QMW23979.1 PH domain-containing protein [Sandaracinobacteroides saxicola]